jgi:SWI/SNF-related matrix-associated actin-dependent regulator 1 of chromatin subfamily A
VNFAITSKKCMINDSMGLGKSIEAIGVMEHLNLKKVLIICPNSLKSNWQREIYKWTQKQSHIVNGELSQGINIINYERLLTLADKEKNEEGKTTKARANELLINHGWELIICDESHYIKQSSALRTKLVLQITANCNRVILLTGTPILNRPKELITQLKAIDRLKDFGKEWDYLQKYCGARQIYISRVKKVWDFSGASNIPDLRQKLEKFTIRRLKEEVLTDLPDKLIHNTTLELPEPKTYYEIENEAKEEFYETLFGDKQFYTKTGKKAKHEQAEALLDRYMSVENKKRTTETLKIIEKLKQEAARQKVIASKDIFEELIETKTKCVVFTVHKKTAYELKNLYCQSVVITGDIKENERMKAIDEFESNPKILFLFATIKTGGTGLNLQFCSNVIFIELDWTPAIHKQAEDRTHRIGQKNKVNINYLIMKDTIDEDIVEILQTKSEVIEGLIEGQLLNKMILKIMTK